MAEQPSNPNPFLGNQPSVTPEKQPLNPGTTASPADFASESIPDSTAAEDSMPTDELTATPVSQGQHRWVWRGVLVGGIVAMIAGGMYWWFGNASVTPEKTEVPAPNTETKSSFPSILPEAVAPVPEGNANYTSENFKAGEIVIGGELQFLVDEAEIGPLTIENIRGEAFTEKNKQEVKLVVTWTTNKLAQATVKYSKGIGQTERGLTEDDYSYNHSLIIAGLDPASTYLYTIEAMDRYGNRSQSEPHAVFTGARTVSLFDLIAGAIGEVFGWAVTNK